MGLPVINYQSFGDDDTSYYYKYTINTYTIDSIVTNVTYFGNIIEVFIVVLYNIVEVGGGGAICDQSVECRFLCFFFVVSLSAIYWYL